MSALVEHTSQLINQTTLLRAGKDILAQVASGAISNLVVVRNSAPVAVVTNVTKYEEVLNEVDELRTELLALRRLTTGHPDAINQSELQQRLGF